MTPQENSELIKHYLRVLKLRKEEYIANYKPTDWELLSREEQIILAAYHAHIRDEEDLETQLLIHRYNRENRENKRKSDRERYIKKSEPLPLIISRQKLELTFTKPLVSTNASAEAATPAPNQETASKTVPVAASTPSKP